MFNFLKNLSPTELGILIAIIVILFGGKAIMSIARTAGESFREIKKINKNFKEAISDDDKDKKS